MESDKPEMQALQPIAGEYNQIKEQIRHFQEQVGTLRAMAQAAREQTLQTLRENMIIKGMSALQESTAPPNQTNNTMAKDSSYIVDNTTKTQRNLYVYRTTFYILARTFDTRKDTR